MELEISHLTKNYGDFKALDNISVSFKEGIYGILGVNGAGKSTLINLITDNISRNKENGGSISLDGTDILKLGKEYRRVLGYMPQQQGLYNDMSPVMFLKYIATLKDMPKKTIKERIDYLLHIVNLWEKRFDKIGSFSGGMKQRVMLAQALLNDPKLLILDEPTAGLDPKERVNLRKFIDDLSKDRIILYATHVVSDIESIADKVMIMDAGKVVRLDTVDEMNRDIATQLMEKGIKKERVSLEDVFMFYQGIYE